MTTANAFPASMTKVRRSIDPFLRFLAVDIGSVFGLN